MRGRGKSFVRSFNLANLDLGYALSDITGGLSAYTYPDQRRTLRLSLTIQF
jgi:hypothetical protein